MAEIVQALTVTGMQDLKFGSIVSDAVGGTVVIAPGGSRVSRGLILLNQSQAGGSFQAARFTVCGSAGYIYTIQLPTTSQTFSGNNDGGRIMTVDTFTSTPSRTGILTLGTSSFSVGATLHVDAAKMPGTYSGNFDVTVAYQ